MRAAVEVEGLRPSVGAGAALVLAEAELWSPNLEQALERTGLPVLSVRELPDLFDLSRSGSSSLLIVAKRQAELAVQACRAMRALKELPCLVVMPREGDLIPVLEAGADDAVVSHVDPEVFAARVRALLRRAQRIPEGRRIIVIHDLVIDLDVCQVTLAGRAVPLTPTEFRILTVLAENAGRVLDPRTILSAVHQHEYSDRDAHNLVKVHIANIRRKLRDSGRPNPYILCVRGFGYMLERRSRHRPGDPLTHLIEDDMTVSP